MIDLAVYGPNAFETGLIKIHEKCANILEGVEGIVDNNMGSIEMAKPTSTPLDASTRNDDDNVMAVTSTSQLPEEITVGNVPSSQTPMTIGPETQSSPTSDITIARNQSNESQTAPDTLPQLTAVRIIMDRLQRAKAQRGAKVNLLDHSSGWLDLSKDPSSKKQDLNKYPDKDHTAEETTVDDDETEDPSQDTSLPRRSGRRQTSPPPDTQVSRRSLREIKRPRERQSSKLSGAR